jgi:hypothetical protein
MHLLKDSLERLADKQIEDSKKDTKVGLVLVSCPCGE